MRDLFPGHYRPTDEELKAIWDDCIFVFDANILLNLYRYPKDTKNDFLILLEKVKDRIWIPHQAALEFQQNRLAVIAEQLKRFREVKTAIEDHRNKLKSTLDSLNLAKKHSSIDVRKLLDGMANVFDPFMEDLNKLEEAQPDIDQVDEIRPAIDKLLDGKIGACPKDQAWLDKVCAQGKTRHARNLPPGYKDKADKKEEDAYLHNGLIFQRQFGDCILWQELVDIAKTDGRFKHVLFVTDDQKEDWWWVQESSGKKTMGPRPELVEEIMLSGNVKGFYMYNPERFVEYAKTALGVELKEDTIKQVREVSAIREIGGDSTKSSFEFESVIFGYIDSLYPDSFMESDPNFFIRLDDASNIKVFDIRDLRTRSHGVIAAILTRCIINLNVLERNYHEATYICIVSNGKQATFVANYLGERLLEVPTNAFFEVGVIGEFGFLKLATLQGKLRLD